MSELLFVGAGLGDDLDLSERARRALAECDQVFTEEYTAALAPGALDRIGVAVGQPLHRLSREELEAGTLVWRALERSPRVGLLVPGDPFAATTHTALRVGAEERGHRWRYLPAASILSAAPGLLGLQPYRFGRVVSLPFPSEGFAPTSPLEMIAGNRSRGLHTLVLLDLRPSEPRYLLGPEALAVLRARDPDQRWLPVGVLAAIIARAGRQDAAAFVGPLERLVRIDAGGPMHCLVLPAATLHFEEERAIARWNVSGVD